MSLSVLGSVTTGSLMTRTTRSGTSDFVPPVVVGQGSAAHGHHPRHNGTRETGAVDDTPVGAAPARTLAADTRALVGDVFGALGADTPTAAAARQAVEAYRQAG